MLDSNNYLYLIWKDPVTCKNFTIGKLSHFKNYQFEHLETHDAEDAGWTLLDAFSDLKKVYESEVLFPVF